MTYSQVLRYLNSLTDFEKTPGVSFKKRIKLKRIRGFLSLLKDPQKSLSVIHVAGSKGKGSTCAFIAYILKEAGYRTGLYTSPHLHDFRERIRILEPRVRNKDEFEGMISKKAISSLLTSRISLIRKFNRLSKSGPLTFFEIYTALAFLYFKQKKVDFAVLETGMGGLWDATNCADSLVQIITPISFEHTHILGRTLSRIACQKAGIIKNKGTITVCAPQTKDALQAIRNKCEKAGSRLLLVGRDVKIRRFKTRLIGSHQLVNATAACAAAKALGKYGVAISNSKINRGIKNAFWPGRCEIIGKRPFIVLDGAQNLASALALKQAILENFNYHKLILVFGICLDKDIRAVCRALEPLADEVILTRAFSQRAAEPKKLAAFFEKKVYLTGGVKEAKILSRKMAGRKDLILVTGSLFVVGEYRNARA